MSYRLSNLTKQEDSTEDQKHLLSSLFIIKGSSKSPRSSRGINSKSESEKWRLSGQSIEKNEREIFSLMREKDTFEILQKQVPSKMEKESKQKVVKIIQSVDELLGLTSKIQEIKKDEKEKEKKSKEEKKIQGEENIPELGKTKSPPRVPHEKLMFKKIESEEPQNDSIKELSLDKVVEDLKSQSKQRDDSNRSILRNPKSPVQHSKSKKNVHFDSSANFLNSAENNIKLKSPPLTPVKYGSEDRKIIKKIQFSSGKKAYKQYFANELATNLNLDGLQDKKNEPEKLTGVEYANKWIQKLDLAQEDLHAAEAFDIDAEREKMKDALERPVDMTSYQPMFERAFREKSPESIASEKESNVSKQLRSLEKRKSKMFQSLILDKMKYSVYLG